MIDFASIKKIAIIGLSPNPSKPSHQVGLYLQKQAYEIFPIYPKAQKILGKIATQDIKELQGVDLDWIVIFRKSEACLELTQSIISLNFPSLKGIWLQLGIHNDAARTLALENGLQFVQNRCIKIERERYES